jgi:antitoxin CptB
MDLTNDIMKRLKIQSWRRGMKEMDLILGRFIDTSGHLLSSDEILKYELLLLQDDQEIFAWFSKQTKTPTDFVDIISKITNSTTLQKL